MPLGVVPYGIARTMTVPPESPSGFGLVLLIATLVMSVLVGVLIARSITRPLAEAADLSGRGGQGILRGRGRREASRGKEPEGSRGNGDADSAGSIGMLKGGSPRPACTARRAEGGFGFRLTSLVTLYMFQIVSILYRRF